MLKQHLNSGDATSDDAPPFNAHARSASHAATFPPLEAKQALDSQRDRSPAAQRCGSECLSQAMQAAHIALKVPCFSAGAC